MKYDEWAQKDADDRREWMKTAPILTEDEVAEVFTEVFNMARGLSREESVLLLRERGIWLSLLPDEGIEDVSVDPRPVVRGAPDGKPRKLKVRWDPQPVEE